MMCLPKKSAGFSRTLFSVVLGCSLLTCTAVVSAQNTVPAELGAALKAYEGRQYQQAADQLKAFEQSNGRAAGVVCELLVRKLLVADDERGQAACNLAAQMHDPHGLVWRGMAGRNGYAAFSLPVSEALTLGFLAEAAELDYAPAYARLCESYYQKSRFQQAAPFCKYAAAKGVPEGLYYFGLMSFDGKGVVQDFQKGHSAMLLSGQSRHAPALLKLAEMARDGANGVDKNPVKAYAWTLLASAADPDAPAIRNIKQALASDIGEQGVAQAQKSAAAWQSSVAK